MKCIEAEQIIWKIFQNSQENAREGVLETATVVNATSFY